MAAPVNAQAGFAELIERLGEGNVPTGAGVAVAQVESLVNGNYRPSYGNSQFTGKTFTLMSGESNASSHATTVGQHFYGLNTSIAPGVETIYCYQSINWLYDGFLRTGAGNSTPPLPLPQGVKVFNNSWISTGGNWVNDALRRADFVVTRDQALMVNGVNNSGLQHPLMCHMYNGLAVGKSNGSHVFGTTETGDGPGRMKPDIVAPGSTTSWGTPVVGAAIALMIDTARNTVPLDQNPLAERSEVIKAVLLGGAKRDENWSNNPESRGPQRGLTLTPYDPVFGAGEVNVNVAHMMLTGGQRPGFSAPALSPHICRTGWDLAAIGPSQSRYWRFKLPAASETVSVVATWHRVVGPTNMSNWSVANFDLRLWRVGPAGNLMPLTGDAGRAFFTEGNVASHSAVDNVELLYVYDLEPGDYVIEVQRMNNSGSSVDVAVSWKMDSAVLTGDITGNGLVNAFDVLEFLVNWGPCEGGVPGCPGDVNCDGVVNGFDLLTLLGQWSNLSH